MEELNLYGDISGWWIFDQLDRYAHNFAVNKIGDCVTASSNIDYFLPVKSMENIIISIGDFHTVKNKFKVNISLEKLTYDESEFTTYATASFLFIKRK